MGKFYYTNSEGLLYGLGEAPDGQETLQQQEGLILNLGTPPIGIGYAPEPIRNYESFRKEKYPAVGAQLDMLWHAMNDGTLNKVPEFYDSIKVVKDNYPKGG
jgi:hypothetical protein